MKEKWGGAGRGKKDGKKESGREKRRKGERDRAEERGTERKRKKNFTGHLTFINFKLGTSFHPFRKRSTLFNLLYLNQLLLMRASELTLSIYSPPFIDPTALKPVLF